jgi:3-oxoacyl-[acyl-carrier protein] reductase
MKLLQGKTALITGASRGIGKGIAEKLAEAGANIAFTFLSSVDKANTFQSHLTSTYGVIAIGYQSDASVFADAEKLVNDVQRDFGTLDILVNNAGITRDNLLMRMTEDQWDEVMNTNLKSAFNLTKFASKPMMKNRWGSIINITSIVGVSGNTGQANYAASKAGMIGFTKSIAKELGSRNIRSNAIAPGFIETEMTEHLKDDVIKEWINDIPLKRSGTAQDVANVVLFLASEMSSFVTGQVIHVCGGLEM